MTRRQVSVTRTIAATPEQIFELLADPTRHPLLDGSGTVTAAREDNPERLELGSTFGMNMKMGARYRITNTVVEYEKNHLIAWRHFGGHRWRWRLEPAADGRTTVTETFDWSTARVPFLIELAGYPARNKAGIVATLDRLAGMFPEQG
ncbi:SRPBCC family protein [Saccharomonospora sp. NPDC046836]|uniref:SRPBCC family protein n=1 Tax=Saccharomonospora sp. NPDC046836 TaxID=3156921 RepID=UPI0033FEE8FB